jgi:class 3 adenylate cyclase
MQRLLDARPDCVDIVEQWYRPAVGLVLAQDQGLSLAGTCVPAIDPPALAYGVGDGDWHSVTSQGVALHVILPTSSGRQASGHRDGYTWSSLLLDEGDDIQRECAETALGLSLGHASAMQAPWVVLDRATGRWLQCQDYSGSALGAFQDGKRFGILFADVVGYSNLSAGDTRRYWQKLLPEATASVLKRHSSSILFRKTWGDAIHVVFRTASAAARAALEMNEATARLAEELEFGRRLEFRTAVHFGTADFSFDPIEEAPTFYGPQLSLAARIVPVAPPGGVFVTEPCAAQLSLEGDTDIECTHVGTTSLPKGYGRVRLLTLTSSPARLTRR